MTRDGDGGFMAFLAALLLLLGIVVLYVDGAVFDSGNFTNHALDALDEKGVRAEVSHQLADALVPAGSQGTIADDAIESASGRLFDAPAFRTIVRAGVGELHSQVFDHDSDRVGVQLDGVGAPVREALQQSNPELAAQLAPSASANIFNGDPPGWVLKATRIAKSVHIVGVLLLIAAALFAVLAFAKSNWRIATLGIFGGSMAIVAVILIAILLIGKSLLTGLADTPGLENALSGVWAAFLGGLQTELILLALAGAAIPIATRLLRLR